MQSRSRVAATLLLLVAVALASVTARSVVFPAPQAPASGPSAAESATVLPNVDEYMQAQVRVNQFSGSILLARQGTTVVSKGYGWANAEWQVPATPQTKYRIGSITKQFTSMAVMQLQELGR